MGSHMIKINLAMLPPPSTCRSLWEWDFAWGDLGGRCMLGHETFLESRSPAWHREMCGSDREFWMVTRQCESSGREVRKSTRREREREQGIGVHVRVLGLLLVCKPPEVGHCFLTVFVFPGAPRTWICAFIPLIHLLKNICWVSLAWQGQSIPVVSIRDTALSQVLKGAHIS